MDEVRVNKNTRAGSEGKDIFCPHCHTLSRVYHFSWSALTCNHCSTDVDKEDWLLTDVSYKGVLEPRHSPSPPMSPFEQMTEQQNSSPVNKKINPSHYKQGDIEVIDFIMDQKMDYLTANIQKYIARWRFKDGVCDLKKAKWFLDKLIEQEEERGGTDTE